jgi:uncharacterized protein (DUF2147 family)
MKKLLNFLFFGLLLVAANAFAGNSAVIGQWQTIDDKTRKPKSIVQIYERGNKVYGKIIKLYRKPGEVPDPVCVKCTDHRKGKKILGMVIVDGLTNDRDEWSGGTILDPSNGKIYRCRIWLDGGQLKVRGYWGFFYRTQTWHRVRKGNRSH